MTIFEHHNRDDQEWSADAREMCGGRRGAKGRPEETEDDFQFRLQVGDSCISGPIGPSVQDFFIPAHD
jgi:hypothetical protein